MQPLKQPVKEFTKALWQTRNILSQTLHPDVVDYLMDLIVKDLTHRAFQAFIAQDLQ